MGAKWNGQTETEVFFRQIGDIGRIGSCRHYYSVYDLGDCRVISVKNLLAAYAVKAGFFADALSRFAAF